MNEDEYTEDEFGVIFWGRGQILTVKDYPKNINIKLKTTSPGLIGSVLDMSIPNEVLGDTVLLPYDFIAVEGHYEDRTSKAFNVKSYMFVDRITELRRKKRNEYIDG